MLLGFLSTKTAYTFMHSKVSIGLNIYASVAAGLLPLRFSGSAKCRQIFWLSLGRFCWIDYCLN